MKVGRFRPTGTFRWRQLRHRDSGINMTPGINKVRPEGRVAPLPAKALAWRSGAASLDLDAWMIIVEMSGNARRRLLR